MIASSLSMLTKPPVASSTWSPWSHFQWQLSDLGEIVIVKDQHTACGLWKLGIAQESLKGQDGLTRAAVVKIADIWYWKGLYICCTRLKFAATQLRPLFWGTSRSLTCRWCDQACPCKESCLKEGVDCRIGKGHFECLLRLLTGIHDEVIGTISCCEAYKYCICCWVLHWASLVNPFLDELACISFWGLNSVYLNLIASPLSVSSVATTPFQEAHDAIYRDLARMYAEIEWLIYILD